jgi:pimeloyl-ACP methyl ester carboxylesterase
MYYELYGEGEPLVLLHGFTQSSELWHPIVADFAKHYQVLVPDLRGHGRSTNPIGQFTHRQAALDIFALLDQVGINRFKAIGFSAGGCALQHMATQQPARVESMVLIGAASYWPEQTRALFRAISVDDPNLDWEPLRQRHFYGDEQIRALINQVHGFCDSYDDMNFTAPYLSTISAKTLIMYGDRDRFHPVSLAVEMYNAIPDSYLWIVPNAAHGCFLGERTALFTQNTLKFLHGDWDSA